MAKSLSARFGLQRWSADSDTQQRSEFDNDAAQLELYAAKAGHGTIGARPAAAAAWADGYWLITDATGGGVLGTLYVCDGATWTTFAPRKQGLATNRPAAALAQQHYYKTDSDLLSIDDGAAWHDFPSKAVTDAAYRSLTQGVNRAAVFANQTGISTDTDLTGLTTTFTAGTGRRYKINVTAHVAGTVTNDLFSLRLKKDGVQIAAAEGVITLANNQQSVSFTVDDTPTAASHTYKLSLFRPTGTGTLTLYATSVVPALLLIEDIGA